MMQKLMGGFLLLASSVLVFAGSSQGIRYSAPACGNLTHSICAGNYCAAIDNLTLPIDMTNYAAVITAALTGQPLNGATPIAVPACLAIATDTAWTPLPVSELGQLCMKVEFQPSTTVISDTAQFPHINPNHAFTLPMSGDASYYLAASYMDDDGGIGYCPCGNLTGTTCSAQSWKPVPLTLNNPFSLSYFGSNADGLDLGYCAANFHNASGEGGFLFNIYAPYGTIPATGSYTADLSLNAEGDTYGSCVHH